MNYHYTVVLQLLTVTWKLSKELIRPINLQYFYISILQITKITFLL